jgi:hypothetical protein
MRSLRLSLLALVLVTFAPPLRADPIVSLLDRAVVLEASRLAVARAGLSPGASSSLASRARNAAWLPSVSVRVARNTGAATTQYATATGDRQLLDDSLFVDVRVSLSLDRLVFDPHEVALWRDEQRRAERRAQLESAVLDALCRLEQLRLQRAAQAPDAPADLAWRYENLRARARVELLTGVPVESLLAPPSP